MRLLLAVVFALGCTGLERGYEQPDTGATSTLRAHGVTLQSVNGISPSPMASGVELLPGKNSIEVSIDQGSFGLRGTDRRLLRIDFNADPGREYVVTGQRGEGRLCVWEWEEQTGAPSPNRSVGCWQGDTVVVK